MRSLVLKTIIAVPAITLVAALAWAKAAPSKELQEKCTKGFVTDQVCNPNDPVMSQGLNKDKLSTEAALCPECQKKMATNPDINGSTAASGKTQSADATKAGTK